MSAAMLATTFVTPEDETDIVNLIVRGRPACLPFCPIPTFIDDFLRNDDPSTGTFASYKRSPLATTQEVVSGDPAVALQGVEMSKHPWLASTLFVALMVNSAAHALILSGNFTGIVTDSRIDAESPNPGNVDGERATGTFYFDTDVSALSPEYVTADEAYYRGLSTGLTFSVHGMDVDFIGSDVSSSSLLMQSNADAQSLSIGASEGPYWYASLSFLGLPSSLFTDFDPSTFDPTAVDVLNSSAYFFAGRSFGGTVLLDGLSFDGYGQVGVPEPPVYGLMLTGFALLALARRRRTSGRRLLRRFS